MFLLVKKIDGEDVIIGTAQKRIAAESSSPDIIVYEISDEEYTLDMMHTKIESFEEDK